MGHPRPHGFLQDSERHLARAGATQQRVGLTSEIASVKDLPPSIYSPTYHTAHTVEYLRQPSVSLASASAAHATRLSHQRAVRAHGEGHTAAVGVGLGGPRHILLLLGGSGIEALHRHAASGGRARDDGTVGAAGPRARTGIVVGIRLLAND